MKKSPFDCKPIMAPDGVPIYIDWDEFGPGTSIFVPCINTSEAVKTVKEAFGVSRKYYHQVKIEKGCYGVRIWRLS